ncbi:hypothetical protein AMJ83_03340 [candidate division WOR_3 bacterium SM23_42]|uniref:Cell shape-determining protein MreC n=1 Tax=candidate division WOR_3 bacterium SM23_42 TaxID=1703779 RepID=A0A0S8FU79_UNCW3|nr:MAG: hypothetical protein AMJ83_03340 [candidate division WOR_3 bacterium SM23_42]
MRRQQIILFLFLLIASAVPVFLHKNANVVLSRTLSSFLLVPIKITTNILEYLAISKVRIEKLEILVNQLKLENAQLRDRFNLDTTNMQSQDLRLLKASVIGRDPLNINGYLYIDKGAENGVAMNQPVIAVDGFVGKIRHAGPTSSIVETIENNGFSVSALDINTSIHGVIKSQKNLMFDYIRHTDRINVGDSIQTSGMSEFFPKGILIGTVHRISESEDLFFKHVYVTPAVQVNRLVSLYLILNEHESHTINQP